MREVRRELIHWDYLTAFEYPEVGYEDDIRAMKVTLSRLCRYVFFELVYKFVYVLIAALVLNTLFSMCGE